MYSISHVTEIKIYLLYGQLPLNKDILVLIVFIYSHVTKIQLEVIYFATIVKFKTNEYHSKGDEIYSG